MKKKILSLILIISVFASLLSGCSILSKNSKRDGERPIATISYAGLEATLTKLELLEYFAANGSVYIQYYGMTAEQVLDLFKESLANSKLNILKARVAVCESMGLAVGTPIVDLLTKAEQKKAIDDTNKIFEDAYAELVKEVQTEQDLLNKSDDEEEDEEEEEEDTHTHDSRLTPRTTKTVEEVKFDPYEVIEGDLPKNFLDTVAPANKVDQEALRRLKDNLKTSERDFDYYLLKQHETIIVDHYKREIVEKSITVTDAEIQVRYDEIFSKNKDAYGSDKDKYLAAIKTAGAGTNVVQQDGYVFVKQILIKFSDKQTKDIETYGKSINNEAALNQYRMNKVNDISTNISNTEYNAEKDCIGYIVENGVITTTKYDVAVDTHPVDHKCSADGKTETDGKKSELCPRYPFTEFDVPYADVLNRILTDINAETTVEGKIKAFDKWIYLVNDDTGMFNNASGYCITPEGDKSEYVESFTELGRALEKLPIGSYAIEDTQVDATKFTLKNFVGSGSNGDVTMAISTYGIHIMISTQKPLDGENVTEKDGLKCITLDYLVNPGTNKTLKDLIKDAILTEKKTDGYSYKNIEFITANKNAITFIDKTYNKIVKEVNKQYNA